MEANLITSVTVSLQNQLIYGTVYDLLRLE